MQVYVFTYDWTTFHCMLRPRRVHQYQFIVTYFTL